MTFELAVTQAPHASYLNGGTGADARQFFLRYTQRTWNGPRIAAALSGAAAGDFVTAWADATGFLFRTRLPSDGSDWDTLDWTPHGVWDATTEQVLLGGRRGLTKLIGYSDVTGDWRELPMPATLGRTIFGTVHYYGLIARDPTSGTVYCGATNATGPSYSYNPETEVYTELAAHPTTNGGNGASFEWAADTGRLVKYAGDAQRWLIYNPGTDSWTNPFNSLGHGAHSILRYHATHERHLLLGGTSTANRASLVTSAGVVTLVTDCPGAVSMASAATSWCVAHSSGCWLVRGYNGTQHRVYAAWPNTGLTDVTWEDLGTAPDNALALPTLIPGYASDTALIVARTGLYAWKLPTLTPPGAVVLSGAAALGGVSTAGTIAINAATVLSGAALIGGLAAAGTLTGGAASALSGTAVLGALQAAGTITSAAPSTLLGTAALGGIVAGGSIVSLAPAVLSGAAALGQLAAAGALTGGAASVLSGTAVIGRVISTGALQGLVSIDSAAPTGYYRRNARKIRSGQARSDGAEVMLAIGARRRR